MGFFNPIINPRVDFIVKLTLDKYLDENVITRYELAKRTGIGFQTIGYVNLAESV